jgi:hypothetical protein
MHTVNCPYLVPHLTHRVTYPAYRLLYRLLHLHAKYVTVDDLSPLEIDGNATFEPPETTDSGRWATNIYFAATLSHKEIIFF